MLVYKQELLLTSILFAAMILVILVAKMSIKRFSFIRAININRRKVIFNLCYLIVYIAGGSVLTIIWGIDQKQFVVFISSILAVLGVGFFAQWSILSNLTASVILFFSHPMRIGDRIRILDKDLDLCGQLKDISGFYLFMKTDDGRDITLPTTLVMQKGIEILEDKKPRENKPEQIDYTD